MWIINLLVILYSKHQKQMAKMAKYWKMKLQDYNEGSDEGAVTDSQDEFDQGFT